METLGDQGYLFTPEYELTTTDGKPGTKAVFIRKDMLTRDPALYKRRFHICRFADGAVTAFSAADDEITDLAGLIERAGGQYAVVIIAVQSASGGQAGGTQHQGRFVEGNGGRVVV